MTTTPQTSEHEKTVIIDTASVPAGRIARLARLGSLATGVAGGMLAEGARQLAHGHRPKMGELLLTPANAKRVADELARLRGAAMKVGQLLSLDAGDLLPPELSEIFVSLRADAKTGVRIGVANLNNLASNRLQRPLSGKCTLHKLKMAAM